MMRLRAFFTCRKTMKVLQSYIDGETDEQTGKAVLKHLDKCDMCYRDSEIYTKIKQSVAQPQTDIDAQILERLSSFTKDLTTNEKN